MPPSPRTRLAITIAVLLFATVVTFAVIVRSVAAARAPGLERSRHRAELRSLTTSVARHLYDEYTANRALTTVAALNTPVATPVARDIVDATGGYVWLLSLDGFTIYNSATVRQLSDSARFVLDSVVASVRPILAVSRTQLDSIATGEPLTVQLQGGDFLMMSVQVNLPQSVNRVVAGRFLTLPPPLDIDLVAPLLLSVPLIVLVASAIPGAIAGISLRPSTERIGYLINEVEAISDGRSLHRRIGPGADADIQLSQLTDTLNAMIARLEQSFAGLRRFTADASHELKTPLTVLRADVERAMAASSNRAEQLVALEEALAETTRMADLVESLLALARADEGRFDLVRERVDLQALVRDVTETALLLGEQKKITVRAAKPPPVMVLGDRARLRQLFLNLITNAIKYSSAKGEVELKLEHGGGEARFSVRDTGIGIAAADLPHVFERFWRADRARSRVGERGGFGLGLAISQYIAQAHGGSLTVKSKLGRGSTFTVAIPLEGEAPEIAT